MTSRRSLGKYCSGPQTEQWSHDVNATTLEHVDTRIAHARLRLNNCDNIGIMLLVTQYENRASSGAEIGHLSCTW